MNERKSIIITGSSGFIGGTLAKTLSRMYNVIGLDRSEPRNKLPGVSYYNVDITSSTDMEKILSQIKNEHGNHLLSVIHLVAYYSFSGEESDSYKSITVEGTRWLTLNLRKYFEVEQFIFSSSMLVYAPVMPGKKIKDESPLAPSWPYPQSKVEAEKVLREEHHGIPVVNLRIAGVYDDMCHSPTLSTQIVRIYEKWATSVPFPGNADHGQAFIHLEDLVEAITLLIENRHKLSSFETFVLGEEKVMSFRELQHDIGAQIHNRPWPVIRVPQIVAKTGAKIMEALPFMREPFIKPWMIKHSDEHFEVDISKIKRTTEWTPKRSLKSTLPVMIENLRRDPETWYSINKIKAPFYRSLDSIDSEYERNYSLMAFLNVFLGLWLMGTVFSFGNVGTMEMWSEIITGFLVASVATVSLIPTLRWFRWINVVLACWLLFSPLIFETPSAAAYLNDTLLAALIIITSSYSPSEKKTLGVPLGWSYNPSTAGQRLPIMLLAFTGFLASRYLAAYQLGHISEVWDPFFPGQTEKVLTSSVSKAFPVSDAGLGALTYLLDVVAAAIGGRDRWRSLPWAVILFGVMIIPSGATSIVLIMLQPISVGAWCTLCLFTAFIMLIMVPPAVDEVLASYQFLKRRKKAGESLWKVFWMGSTSEEEEEKHVPEIEPQGKLIHLYLASAISIWLMFTPYVFSLEGFSSSSTYIIAALAITFSIIAMSEAARLLRIMNIPLGLWLIISPWFLSGMSIEAVWNSVVAGLLLILLSLPRGKREERYGETDKIIHWTPLRR